MGNYKILSLDGSGLPSYKHPSKEFGLTGVVIDEKITGKLDEQLRKLKKKFFNNEEVVFHYMEIARKVSVFEVLKDRRTEIAFWSDLLSVLNNPKVSYLFTILDKERARKSSWLEKTIVQRSYAQIIKMFVTLLKNYEVRGKIITESDKFQDEFLIKAHNTYQSTGITSLGYSARRYNETITSLSLVNKSNFDPEIQLADLLGATARLRYRINALHSKEEVSGVEKKKLKLIERKLKQNNAKFKVII